MKSIRINLQLPGGHGDISSAVNIRPHASGGLAAVGAWKLHTGFEGWTPLTCTDSARSQYLFYRNNELGLGTLSRGWPEPLGITLAATPSAAIQRGNGKWLIMTAKGSYEFDLASESCRTLLNSIPWVRLQAQTQGPLTHLVGERRLSRHYEPQEMITATEVAAIGADYSDAYTSVAAQAAAAGVFIQPVLARCRMYDADGELIYESAPALVGLPGAGQCAAYRQLFSFDGQNVRAYEMSVNTFTITAQVGPDPEGAVSRVEVCVSPQFHPYGRGGTFVRARNDDDNQFGRVALSGRFLALSPDHKEASMFRISSALAHIDTLLQPSLELPAPGASGCSGVVRNSRGADIAAESKTLEAALASPVQVRTYPEVMLDFPHLLGAALHAGDAACGVWGNLTAERFSGHHPLDMCSALTPDNLPWTAAVTVQFSGGGALTRSVTGTGPVPDTLGPLLTYPAPDAVRLRVSITCGQKVRVADVPLSPSPCRRFSYYIDPSLTATALTAQAAAAEFTPAQRYIDFPDYIGVYSGNPLSLKSVDVCGGGRVCALTPLRSGDGAWEFGRSRFVAGCENALVSVSVEGEGRRLSRRVIHGRGVSGAAALACTPSGVYAACADALVLVRGTGRSVEIISTNGYESLMYVSRFAELYAQRSGLCTVFCLDYGNVYYTRTDGCGKYVTCGQTPFIVLSSGIISAVTEQNTPLTATLTVDRYLTRPVVPVRIEADIIGGGTASIDSCGGFLTHAGTPDSPLSLRVYCRPQTRLHAVLTLTRRINSLVFESRQN